MCSVVGTEAPIVLLGSVGFLVLVASRVVREQAFLVQVRVVLLVVRIERVVLVTGSRTSSACNDWVPSNHDEYC